MKLKFETINPYLRTAVIVHARVVVYFTVTLAMVKMLSELPGVTYHALMIMWVLYPVIDLMLKLRSKKHD